MSSLPPFSAVSARSLYRTLLREAARFFDDHSRAYLRHQIRRDFRRQTTLTFARECLDALQCANQDELKSCEDIMRRAWGREGEVRVGLMRAIHAHGGRPEQALIEAQFLPKHREFQPQENVEYSPSTLEKLRRKYKSEMLSNLQAPVPYAWRAKLESLAAGNGVEAPDPEVREQRVGLYRMLLDETPVFMTLNEEDQEESGAGVEASVAGAESTDREEGPSKRGRDEEQQKPPAGDGSAKQDGASDWSLSGAHLAPRRPDRMENFLKPVVPFLPGRLPGEAVDPGQAVLEEALHMGSRLVVGKSLFSNAGLASEGKPPIGPIHTWGLVLEGEGQAGKKRKKMRKKRVKRGRFDRAEGLPFAERAVL